jgi:putative hydrolase of HD superfamily
MTVTLDTLPSANIAAQSTPHRLNAQFAFLLEADRLKSVVRANELMDGSRFENSAEHSWHAALLALICAPLAGPDVDIDTVIAMLILHDIVEIDVGDHPIHLPYDRETVQDLEVAAAARIFGLLPDDQHALFNDLWHEFEAMQTPSARFAKAIDFLAPALLSLGAKEMDAQTRKIVGDNLSHGRAAKTKDIIPELYDFTCALLEGRTADPVMAQRFAFWCAVDPLKSVLRATPIMDGSRPENSGEHSWHVMLYALTLADQGLKAADAKRAIIMMLLHDIVEVDAGDNPIHGAVTAQAQRAQLEAELKAAERLFGLLPEEQGQALRLIWDEFETAQTPTALYAKSIDRAQPVLHNLANDGGSWRAYSVTLPQIETRVGAKVTKGCPSLWPFIRARIEPWFISQNAT